MIEVWKNIEGYEGLYEVSNFGRVKSLNYNHTGKEKILVQIHNSNDYCSISLCKNNIIKKYSIHRLMAEAFLPNPNNLPCVNHKDEKRDHNFIWINEDGNIDFEKSNLEWCDYSHNNNYGMRNEKCRKACLNSPKMSKRVSKKLNGKIIAIYPSTAEAARQTGLNQGCISNCCLGRAKKHGGYEWKYID